MKTILEIIIFYSNTYNVIWRKKKKVKYMYTTYVCAS